MPFQRFPVQEKGDIPEELLPPSGFIEGLRIIVAPEGEGVLRPFKIDGETIVKSLDGFGALILKGIPDFDDRIRNTRLEGQLLVDDSNIGHL